MDCEVKEKSIILNDNGIVKNEGWARFPLWEYKRKLIKASKWRIKEWDYYIILSSDKKHGIALTISDLGYIGLSAILFLDFKNNFYYQVDSLIFFPFGNLNLPENSYNGLSIFKDKKLFLQFESQNNKKILKFSSPYLKDYYGNQGIKGEIILYFNMSDESIVNLTTWKKNKKNFFYTQKMNCLKAEGEYYIGKTKYIFEKEKDFCTMDWGRGVWAYKNRWIWSSLNMIYEQNLFGWNLGDDFGDRTHCTDNGLFFNGRIHKLKDVYYDYDYKNVLKQWHIKDNQNRLNIVFNPIFDRNSRIDFLIIKSIQHQVFGYFNGKAILDDGRIIKIKNALGFIEDVINYW